MTTRTRPALTAADWDRLARAYWDEYRQQDGFAAPYDRLGDTDTIWIKRGLAAALDAYDTDHRLDAALGADGA